MPQFKQYFLFIVTTLASYSALAQPKTNSKKQTVIAFAAAINTHDPKGIAALLTNDHLSIDATGTLSKGKENTLATWSACFTSTPNYYINITQVFVQGDTIAAFGFAEGSPKGNEESHWQLPTSWKAVVKDQKIALWQAYSETKPTAEMPAKNNNLDTTPPLPRATGIGGIFFKCKDPKSVKAWYKEHLHMDVNQYGSNFEWRLGNNPDQYGCSQWSPFNEKTTYFAPSTKEFMINYRVDHLDQLIEQLRKHGVTIVDTIDKTDYGNFIHILDCEQNKIELWEPKEALYDKVIADRKKTTK